MAEELKACPCCGNAEITDDESYIMCMVCGLMIDRCDAPGNDYVKAWNTRAQLPSQGGEAVEVVATVESYGGKWAGIHWGDCIGSTEDPERQLMTVAQHQRILAAATHPAAEAVGEVKAPRALIEHAARILKNANSYTGAVRELAAEELRALLSAKP